MKSINLKSKASFLLASFLILSCLSGFSGCKKKDNKSEKNKYKVKEEEFYFSTDNGSTYGNRRVEFPVGDTVYMQVVIYIESTDEEEHEIEGQLSIPNIKAVDAYYLKGQKITPKDDKVNKLKIYPFKITTNESWTFFFEFVPNETGKLAMELTFDDNIDEKYDMTNTIKIVEAEEIEEDDDEKDVDDNKKKDEDD